MTKKFNPFKNYIDLLSLKTAKLLRGDNLNITLDDDIWDEDTLIVRRGKHLTESLLNKLLNFGIKRVSVNLPREEASVMQDFPLSDDFIKTQNVLIIANVPYNTGVIANTLTETGFHRENITTITNYNLINKYFRFKKINFIFIELNQYEKCSKCIEKYSLLRDTHVFVLVEPGDSLRKLKNSYNSEIKFLIRPIIEDKKLKFLINRALRQNMLNRYMDGTSKIAGF